MCAIVRASGFNRPLIYTSFLQEELQHVRRANPDAQTMILFRWLPTNPSAAAAKLHATHVGLRLDTVTKPLVTALHNEHLIVFTYTANQPIEISKMKMLGVERIISRLSGPCPTNQITGVFADANVSRQKRAQKQRGRPCTKVGGRPQCGA